MADFNIDQFAVGSADTGTVADPYSGTGNGGQEAYAKALVDIAGVWSGTNVIFKNGSGPYRMLLEPTQNGSLGNPSLFRTDVTGLKVEVTAMDDANGLDVATDTAYQWNLSGSGTNEYYLTINGATTVIPLEVKNGVVDGYYMGSSASDGRTLRGQQRGTVGSLLDLQIGWGNNDTLSGNTLYCRFDDNTPASHSVEIARRSEIQDIGWNYHEFEDIEFTGGTEIVSAARTGYNFRRCAFKFPDFDGVEYQASADNGTTDGATTAFKLIESGQNFLTTVSAGMTAVNTTDNTVAVVTNVDSNTQLTLDTDIMATGEVYRIVNPVNLISCVGWWSGHRFATPFNPGHLRLFNCTEVFAHLASILSSVDSSLTMRNTISAQGEAGGIDNSIAGHLDEDFNLWYPFMNGIGGALSYPNGAVGAGQWPQTGANDIPPNHTGAETDQANLISPQFSSLDPDVFNPEGLRLLTSSPAINAGTDWWTAIGEVEPLDYFGNAMIDPNNPPMSAFFEFIGTPFLVTPHGDQSNLISSTANIDLSTNYTGATSYSVEGLPSGLTASILGVVTGTVTAPAGAYPVTVTAINGSQSETPQTFTWYALTAGSGATTINSLINSTIN